MENKPPELDFNEIIKTIDKIVQKYILYIKSGISKEKPDFEDFMESCGLIPRFCDRSDSNSAQLLSYYCEIIKKFILDYKNELINHNSIDDYLVFIAKINYFIFNMRKMFNYLNLFYVKQKVKTTLSKIAMDIYKSIIFEEIKQKKIPIFNEIDKLINEERSGNKESKDKIKDAFHSLKC